MIIFIQGIPLNLCHLLIPVLYIMLAFFALGIGLILSALMVFFRDMQFIYNVLIMLWTYLTPLFYSIDIVPERFLPIYKLNSSKKKAL